MVLRCDESAKQINELHGVHGPGTCRIENALPDAAFHCQATFAIDLQIFRLKTVRDFHFGILRNILARPDMEKERNMNRKDTGDISGCRFDLSWLFWHSFRTENGFAEKCYYGFWWILDVLLCFLLFVYVCWDTKKGAAWGCITVPFHGIVWDESSPSTVLATRCQWSLQLRPAKGKTLAATSMQLRCKL